MEAPLLARAFVGSCQLLGLDQTEQANLLYLDVATYTDRVLRGHRLDPDSPEGRRARLVLRLHERLDRLGTPDQARLWYRAHSGDLDAVPAELANGLDGLGMLVRRLEEATALPA